MPGPNPYPPLRLDPLHPPRPLACSAWPQLRFTCLANGCRAVNVKPISPESFNSGTVFAQCGRCSKWHLIRDHLNLWDQSRKTVYRNGKRVVPPPPLSVEEVPAALRPAIEDLDFFLNGGKVSGWEQPPPARQ
jgi:hypothetical protein